MDTRQLSLWESEAPALPPGYRLVPSIGETIEVIEPGWADGDTSPAQLARLAHTLLHICNRETFFANDGTWIWFDVVGTRVEGDHVVSTLKRIVPLHKSYAECLRERGGRDTEREQDE